jgi:hypothetical protein
MWPFATVKQALKAVFPDPRENSELVGEIRIHSKGEFSLTGEYCLTIECRKNQSGNFGILTISQGDGVNRYYLNKEEFEHLTRSLAKYHSPNASR